MEEKFLININYNGKEMDFTAQLWAQGISYKFKVMIDGTEVFFEPDEEGSYRAVRMPWQEMSDMEKLNKKLLGIIAAKIEEILS
jgi:hypothetical protein